MSADLQRRIARVLVRSQHATLPASKIDELVDLGVGMATAKLVLDELDTAQHEPHQPKHMASSVSLAAAPEPDPTSTKRLVISRGE